ncbi:VQ protein [Dillenia turbinata]|uniref:VQ protein n=1 Tax=Dillenia turbinata TaxID=194707 RepID=A0AAN8Z655_9MAGN
MEGYSNYGFSSSTSSNSSSSMNFSVTPQDLSSKKQQPFKSSLHSIRKTNPMKPMKKPIAPLPPIPPKVYRVDSINFREVVQHLTGAPEFQAKRLQSVAPPPLNLAKNTPLSEGDVSKPLHTERTPLSAFYRELMSDSIETTKPVKYVDHSAMLGMSLSPSSFAWCSFPLLSPGALSSLQQSTVL